MDDFEKRLKQDANAVNADISSDLRSRIDASLRGVEQIRSETSTENSQTNLWWVSSLTGLAAAIAIIVMLNLNQAESISTPGEDSLVSRPTVPETPDYSPLFPPILDVQAADFASPLEEELLKLQLDLEKARDSVREDVDFTF
ncbi:MAG: hypothetical protein HOI35_08335 [Woeseia sp.]|jgi:hypothetical protein|nr:hypothetical protein [Woeseia sp.]MBT6210010.1 hypothetical protein [Woeseia sp.]